MVRKKDALCYSAAKLIIDSIEKNRNVIITSGFPVMGSPETDGLIGAISFASVIQKIGMKPIIITDEININIHKLLAKKFLKKPIKFMLMPVDNKKAEKETIDIINSINPVFMIAIERPVINKNGKYFDMNGNDISKFVGKTDFLFNEARKQKISTIGIGDGGNEIGMGNIYDKIRDLKKKIASTTKVDALIVSSVSNWGTYGLIASLSILMDKNFCHDGKIERKMIKTCIDNGAIDGITKMPTYSVDGIDSMIHESIVNLIYNIVEIEINENNL